MGRREDLLRAEELGWRELNALIDGLADEQLERPGLTPDGWSVKNMMWHIACWSSDCVHALEQMTAGTFTGVTIVEETETVNRQWFEASRELDPVTVRAEWYSARALMVERFAASQPSSSEAEEWFEESGPLHYAKHLADLRAWGSRLRAEPR